MRIALPIPPSVNAMFVNSPNSTGKGRFPSSAYKAWKRDVEPIIEQALHEMPPIEPPYAVCIRINVNRQSDIDNRTKAILDALVAGGVLCGDQWVDDCRILRDGHVKSCEVEVTHLAETNTPRDRHMLVVERLADEAGISKSQVMGDSRRGAIVRVRHAAMQYFHNEGWSLARIGRFFGRDHTTVLAALRKGTL